MKVLLVALGSHGDVHPFVGIGLALRSRGHDVTIAAFATFEQLVRRVGLEFAAIGTADRYRSMIADPDLWDGLKGTRFVLTTLGESLRPVYQTVLDHYVPGESVVVASSLAIGARVAQDKHGVPVATAHLQPIDFRSAFELPVLPGLSLPRHMPQWCRRAIYRYADWILFDRLLCPELNAFRHELGLPPVKRVLQDWWNSPQRVIGLFPDWFGSPRPDWPPQTVLTGFPLYDERDTTPLDEELLQFLNDGSPPIAFTPGSAMWRGADFFAESAAACALSGQRGLLLSRHPHNIPAKLPPGVRHVEYAPFSLLLPRCAALVHHGGIGTSAQGLAAGVPQLVMPMGHDQPDNAARLKRLGVAESLSPHRYRARAVAAALGRLISSEQVKVNCRAAAERLNGSNAVVTACEVIEGLTKVAAQRSLLDT